MTRLISLLAGLVLALAAHAHTPPKASVPAADSSVAAPQVLELTFGGWNAEEDTVYDLGFTPVFRFVRSRGQPYFEAAIGFHVLSDLDFKDGVQTSTHFQFGDHIGAGIVYGRYDWSVRLRHLSNAGIRNPNPGINFLQLRLQYSLD